MLTFEDKIELLKSSEISGLTRSLVVAECGTPFPFTISHTLTSQSVNK